MEINAHVYTEILDNFLIPLIENLLGDDSASFHRAKKTEIFLQKNIKTNDVASEQFRSKSN